MRSVWLCVALLLVAPRALGQATPPAQPQKPAAKADDDSDSLDEPDDDAPAKKPAKDTPSAAAPRKQPELPPPPPEPRADEQEPRPYLPTGGLSLSQRHVEIGPDAGVWFRPAKGDGVSYAPGFAYGAHARAELFRELGFRIYVSQARHAVDVPRGELGLADTDVNQPDLEVIQFGARVEPTWMPIDTLRLWAGLGVAWASATAPEPTSSGATEVHYSDRSGVFLEYSLALGASWDVVPRWFTATLWASGGLISDASGDLFHDHQVIDQNGQVAYIGGLPEMASSVSVGLGVGMIL